MNQINSFAGKKVLIFGLGLNQGGVGSALFFARLGAKVKITDLKSVAVLKSSVDQLKNYPEITYTLGQHKFEDIDWADLIIKNPAVKPNNPYLGYALKKGKKVEQDMGIFLELVKPEQIIGITGTKGKSTTASLIYEVLKEKPGAKLFHPSGGVVLAGNIGKSVLDVIEYINKDTLIVLEISSFQLEAFKQHQISPKWAIITNIYPDHLNYYKNMDQYIAAKKIIAQHQRKNDFLFLNQDDQILKNPKFLKGRKGQIIFYSMLDLPDNLQSNLKGEHNKSNMAAALAVGKTLGIEKPAIFKTFQHFKGVPFRMELIKKWQVTSKFPVKAVNIINDTTATGPDAGIEAIKTGAKLFHPSGGIVLICGGMNKGLDYTKYAAVVSKLVNKVFFLEGDATDEIKKKLQTNISLDNKSKAAVQFNGTYNNLEKLLIQVKKVVTPGDLILFSPAATSFNLFQNEFDRGRQFNQAVEKIFK